MSRLAPQKAVADFDSATAMLRCTARALRGQDFPRLGQGRLAGALAPVVNLLPVGPRRVVYAAGGVWEAFAPDRLGDVDTEQIAAWMAGHYPAGRYPGVAVGASNGAAVHLYAALGIPWLPTTYLLPVRWLRNHPDHPKRALEFGARVAPPLLAANPDVALHHMHDGNQDRLMIQGMAYFRLKRLRLGRAYERFLRAAVAPGAPVVVIDDRSMWPTTRVGDRHVFQFGAQGGATVEEYHHGGPRVAEFLQRHHTRVRRWDAPEPNGASPEAEWGLAPELGVDVERWAHAHGHPMRRLVLRDPEDFSPVVAELCRQRYRQLGWRADRLLVESFILQDPVGAVRAGCVPFWTKFSVEPSVRRLASYLDRTEPYAEILAFLFPHGVDSIGLADTAAWRAQLAWATRHGGLLGVDTARFPADFAALSRYHSALRRVRPRRPLPAPTRFAEVDHALSAAAATGAIGWT